MVMTQVPHPRAAAEDRRDWWRLAACREADPELFFPVTAQGPAQDEIAQAKALCAGCQVRRECLQFALATSQRHGVWGGTTEAERLPHVRREREQRDQRERAARAGREAARVTAPRA
jgi:WhiB family redox-sensing transcriptional regulator